MPTVIEENVVRMQFENDGFEKGVKESLLSIEKLKKSLDFKDAADGIVTLESRTSRFNLDPIANSLTTVQAKFSAFEIMAVNALLRIENKAIDTAEALVKSLSIDQVSAGWDKYAQKTTSVQTIMSATADDFEDTGTQMAYVNDQLEKLNWFTDETSYNFLDMVNNIGKFTSNRIPLDESVTAMQGISTWAAMSGANIAEAGRAMYNLSQAISVGSVKLMDWKSIENANMATSQFKQTALDTAVAMGTLQKVNDDLYKTTQNHEVSVRNFNEALKDEWFTSEVLLATLQQYGGFTDALYDFTEQFSDDASATTSDAIRYINQFKDGTLDMSDAMKKTGMDANDLKDWLTRLGEEEFDLGRKSFAAAQEAKTFQEAIDSVKDAVSTGWMNTFELIFGNYEEAKVLWTDLANSLYDVFALGGENRNALLTDALTSNWKNLNTAIKQAGISTEEFEAAIAKSFKEAHGYKIDNILAQYESLEDAFYDGAVSSNVLRKALLSLEKDAGSGIENVVEGMKIGATGDAVKELQQKLLELDQDLSKYGVDGIWGKETQAALENFQKMSGIEVTGIIDQATLDAIREADEGTQGLTESLEEFIAGINEKGGRQLLIEGFANIGNFIIGVLDDIKAGFRAIFPEKTADDIYNMIAKFNELTQVLVRSDDETSVVRNVFQGFFAVLRVGVSLVSAVAKGLWSIASAVAPLGGGIIKNIAASFSNWATETAKWVTENNFFGNAVDSCITHVKNLSTQFAAFVRENPRVQNILGYLTTAYNNLKLAVSGIDITGKLAPYKDQLITFRDTIINFGKTAGGNFLAKLEEKLAQLAAIDWSKSITSLQEFGNSVKERFLNIISYINIDAIKLKIDQIIGFFGEMKSSGGEALDEFLDMIMNFGSTIIAIFTSIDFQTLAMIGTLTSLMYMFTRFGKMANSIEGAAGSIGEFFDALKNGIAPDKSKEPLGNTILKFSAAIAVLAYAIKMVSDIPADRLGSATQSIVAMMVTLGGLVIILGILTKLKVLNGTMKDVGTAFIMLAGAVALLALALKTISDIPFPTLQDGMNILVLLVGMLGAATIIIAKFAPKLSTGSIFMVALAGAVYILVGALDKLNQLKLGPEMASNIAFLGIIVGLLSLLAVSAGQMHFGSGVGMIALMNALAKFIAIFYGMQFLDLSAVKDKVENYIVVFGTFIALGAIMGKLDSQGATLKVGIGMAALMIGIEILIDAMKKISKLSSGEVQRGAVGVGVIMLAFMGLLRAVKGVTKDAIGAGVGMILISTAIILISSSVEKIGSIPQSTAERGLKVIAVIGLVFMALLKVSKNVSGSFTSYLGLIIAIGAVVGALFALYHMTENLDRMERVATILRKVMTSLALAMAAANFKKMSFASVLAMVASIGSVTAALILLSDEKYDIDRMSKVAEIMNSVLQTLSILTLITNLPFVNVGSSAQGAGALDIQIANILAILFVLDQLNTGFSKITDGTYDLDTIIDRGLPLLEKLSGGLGRCLGVFIGQVAVAITEEAIGVAINLTKFAQELTGFAEIMGGEQMQASVAAISAISELVAALTKADWGDFWTSVFSKFLGVEDKDFGTFSRTLGNLADGLKVFATQTKGISPSDVESATAALDLIVQMQKKIPKDGGWVQKIIGYPNMKTFGTQLKPLGEGLKEFVAAVDGLSMDNVEPCAAALTILADMSSHIETSGGKWQDFFGEIDYTKFSLGLFTMGHGLSSYANSIKDISVASVLRSGLALQMLVDISNKLDPTGGISGFLFGEQDLGEFGNNMAELATGITDYWGSIKDVNSVKMMGITSALADLSAAFADMEQVGFSGGVATFMDNLTGLTTTELPAFLDSFTAMYPLANTTGYDYGNQIILGIQTALSEGLTDVDSTDMYGIVDTICNAVLEELLLYKDTFYLIGGAFVTRYVNGIVAKKLMAKAAGHLIANYAVKGMQEVTAYEAATTLVDTFIATVSSKRGEARTYGQYFAEGFVVGLQDRERDVRNEASELAKIATDTFAEKTEINSPSKVMYRFGGWFVDGFVNAVDDNAYRAKDSVFDMGSHVVSAYSDFMDEASRMESTMNLAPSITPVFDLTKVQNERSKMQRYVDGTSMQATIVANAMSASNSDKFDQLIANTAKIVTVLASGSNVYLDENTIVGRINRRLGGYMA